MDRPSALALVLVYSVLSALENSGWKATRKVADPIADEVTPGNLLATHRRDHLIGRLGVSRRHQAFLAHDINCFPAVRSLIELKCQAFQRACGLVLIWQTVWLDAFVNLREQRGSFCGGHLDRLSIAKELMVLIVTALSAADLRISSNKLNAGDPLYLLEA